MKLSINQYHQNLMVSILLTATWLVRFCFDFLLLLLYFCKYSKNIYLFLLPVREAVCTVKKDLRYQSKCRSFASIWNCGTSKVYYTLMLMQLLLDRFTKPVYNICQKLSSMFPKMEWMREVASLKLTHPFHKDKFRQNVQLFTWVYIYLLHITVNY